MKAVDTNVLARFLVDDPDDAEAARQRPAAVQVMSGEVFVTVTVLLELEWVFRGFYELPRTAIVRTLKALCGLPNVEVEDRSAVLDALDAHARGLDLADALHLARSSRCAAFVTFDRDLTRKAARLKSVPPVEAVR